MRTPWRSGASKGEVIQATFETLYGQASGPHVTFSASDQAALVSFTLPDPRSGKVESLNGELHLRWPGAVKVPPPGLETRPIVRSEREDEPEFLVGELVRKMTPAQRSVFDAKIPPKPISKKGVAALRAAAAPREVPSLPARVLRSNPLQVKAIPSALRIAKNQQLLDALHAVYGPNIPGFSPSQGGTPPGAPTR